MPEGLNEVSMRRIIREEVKAATAEAIHEYITGRVSEIGELLKPTRNRNGHLLCSFCGRPQTEVKKLVGGPGVHICDSCIGMAHEAQAKESAARK